ncbi:AP-4 complex accessory subunit RUSC2-like [Osmerus mordax]|uniref:AP-4 complex accessory subunit RUSC2-like n=1 Tax=Osmerus mordax TaxID=8014 RepID=UPI00350FB9BE
MDSPSKLSGETLIVHHIPLVHCQVSGGRQGGCGGSLRRSHPFSPPENLGLSRTTSLPERDVLQREALLYSSLVHASCRPGGGGGGRGGSTASDDSSYTSSNSGDQPTTAHTLPRTKPRNHGNRLRHNPFLLNTEDDEEEEEDDGDNLNGYLEDSSFHLHGNANSTLDDGVPPFHLHDLGFPPEPFLLHGTLGKPWGSSSRESLSGTTSDLSAHLETLDLLGLDSQRRHGSSGSNMSMDCGEQEWGEDEEEEEEDHPKTGSCSSSCSAPPCSCRPSRTCPQLPHFSEPYSDCQLGYGSDSSCNSSDGVLVNFSAIFNKMNNSVPAKVAPGPSANLNSSAQHSCVSEPGGGRGSCHGGGAFYLDLHTSPTDPPQPQHAPCPSNTLPVYLQETPTSTTSPCTCSAQHQGPLDLDDNCNSYQKLGEAGPCLQSQARLVVATQNYYKLVTCDLSSQSSPSPVASSATSCSDEHSKESPTPTEYFLFRHQAEEGGGAREEDQEDEDRQSPKRDEEEEEEEEEVSRAKRDVGLAGSAPAPGVIEGQVYVNISPPIGCRADIGGGVSGGHTLSRSYDRSLAHAPPPGLGPLERMLSCPMRLSEGAGHALGQATPTRVTSFAEMARCKRRTGALLRTDPLSGPHAPSAAEPSPPAEQLDPGSTPPPCPLTRCYSQGSTEAQQTRSRTGGSLSCSPDCCPAVVRYSKDQRPTSLPIQPFTFHHQFSRPQPKPLLPLLTGYVSGMQARSGSGGSGGPEGDEVADEPSDSPRCSGAVAVAPPGSVRPSPLGSYSPVRLQGAPSSGSCSTCTPSPPPPTCLSCPRSPHAQTAASLPPTPPLGVSQAAVPPSLPPVQGYQRGALPSTCISPGGPHVSKQAEHSQGPRQHHAHHLSPQALKWREYRRRNPLGVERAGRLDPHRGGGGTRARHARRNVFDFPATSSRFTGPSVKQLQQYYSDYLPDYFSLAERPPEEFCLSPDASSSSSSSSEISVDLQQMRGLVKAINTAIDLIVDHFGTSRDPDVKAKLGNSWVSPNVGHLILKYLCPALRGVLQDGLKPHVLDLIIGQRRNQPWSLVEASTQLGPSTRVLHSLFSKVSQYSELTSHSMRLNAFIFGLLNLRSLEFWFNHLHTHEDILAVHYQPWGFLPLSQGPCQPLFQELLLLLQPLSLLPFHLDFLFEPHLLQKGQEHLRRKELLCSADQSARSTFQLMRGWGTPVVEGEGVESGAWKRKRAELRREGTWPGMEGAGSRMEGVGQGEGLPREGGGMDSIGAELGWKQPMVDIEEGISTLWRERGSAGQRVKGVGGESHQDNRDGEKKKEREGVVSEEGRQKQERQAGWWYQLMQSSQVYIDQSAEGSKFTRSEKRKKSGERRASQLPPTREGVVEGAESRPEGEEPRKRSSSADSVGSRGRRAWMGSPPDSVLCQEKEKLQGPTGAQASAARPQDQASAARPQDQPSAARPQAQASAARPQDQASAARPQDQASAARPQDQALSQGMRWGRLFGSSRGSSSRADDSRQAKTQRSRLPSGWLSLDRSVLDMVAQTVGAGSGRRVEPSAPPLDSQAPPLQPQTAQAVETKSPCEVRALCHHIATEPGQLSFHKGDVLRVLAQPDSHWLLCSLGASRGLVPLIYVTLRSLGGPPHGGPH